MFSGLLRRIFIFIITRIVYRGLVRMFFRTLLLIAAGAVWVNAMTVPARAQGVFSTNTPAPAPFIIGTNTPAAPLPLPTAAPDAVPLLAESATPAPTLPAVMPTPRPIIDTGPSSPQAPLERYAARLWTESALVSLLTAQAQQLASTGSADAAREQARALRLTQYELERRFPGAPYDAAARATLLGLLLNAPPGSVDARALFRLALADTLNAEQPQTDVFDRAPWHYELAPLNAGGQALWLVHARAAGSDPQSALYETYVVARQDEAGVWSVLPATPEYPALPYTADRLTLERVGDITGDNSDEIVLAQQRASDLNRMLYLYGVSGDRVDRLTLPGEMLRYGEIVDFPARAGRLTVEEYQIASPLWGCIAQTEVTWVFERNAFRPIYSLAGALPQETLACRLAAYDSIFARPVVDAISIVSTALDASSRDEGSASRAEMVLAVLYALNGEGERALAEVQRLNSSALTSGDRWLSAQTRVYLATAQAGATPLSICFALAETGSDAACNFDAVFSRLMSEIPPRRDLPLDAQLNALGAPPFTLSTVSEVGRFPRQAVAFVGGSGATWQFAPGEGDLYGVEVLPAPPAARNFQADMLATIYATLIDSDNPVSALALIETRLRETPNDPELLFLRAFAYDMLSDRQAARIGYYAAWQPGTDSLWGRLAGAHLEQR